MTPDKLQQTKAHEPNAAKSQAADVVETTFYVRYAETDQMGIVHHSTYVVWMEEGRSDYMRQKHADYAAIEKSGLALAVTELNVRYLAPAHYGEQVTVRTWVDSLRSRMLVFGYEIVNTKTKQKLITGSVKLTMINQHSQVVSMPQEIQSALRPPP
jgi:acyl-CoA thioester hydrolase